MENNKSLLSHHRLLFLLLVYCAASLLHFVHNAIYLNEYPNLPAWITQAGVYITWLGITAIGVTGYIFLLRGHRFSGLLILVLYGVLGLDGLGHYTRAPMTAHTTMMNLTIWLEVVSAVMVLVAIFLLLIKHNKPQSEVASGVCDNS